jgi:hypothetical protein
LVDLQATTDVVPQREVPRPRRLLQHNYQLQNQALVMVVHHYDHEVAIVIRVFQVLVMVIHHYDHEVAVVVRFRHLLELVRRIQVMGGNH